MIIKEVIKKEDQIEIQALKHLRFEKSTDEYIVTLIDKTGFEILKGYGKTTAEAINDLHQNLI